MLKETGSLTQQHGLSVYVLAACPNVASLSGGEVHVQHAKRNVDMLLRSVQTAAQCILCPFGRTAAGLASLL